jgi:meiotically up-regulated gene 157 (Mug157) protein
MLRVKQDMTEADSSSAYEIQAVYTAILDTLTVLSRCGNRFAAREIIRTMTRQNQDLCELGYRVEDGGGITVITQEWIDQQIENQSERDKLIQKFRETNDPKCLHDIILLEEK